MRVGATIAPQHMDVLRSSYTKIHVSPKYSLPIADSGFRAPAKRQFEIALAKYKNDGTPFNFNATRCQTMACLKDQDELPGEQKLMSRLGPIRRCASLLRFA